MSTSSNDSNNSGVTVYEDESTPGPGYYSTETSNLKKDFRSMNQKFKKIFYSQSQRCDL